jgi:hypothetical protein
MARTKSTSQLGFEAKLWLAADKLRNNMDAAEYKHVVLGLIFLKYISDSFEEHRQKLLSGSKTKTSPYAGANAEDPDEYRAENIFWVPQEDCGPNLLASAKQPSISKTVDDAMLAIERNALRGGIWPTKIAKPEVLTLNEHFAGTVSSTALSRLISPGRWLTLEGQIPTQTEPSLDADSPGYARGGTSEGSFRWPMHNARPVRFDRRKNYIALTLKGELSRHEPR